MSKLTNKNLKKVQKAKTRGKYVIYAVTME